MILLGRSHDFTTYLTFEWTSDPNHIITRTMFLNLNNITCRHSLIVYPLAPMPRSVIPIVPLQAVHHIYHPKLCRSQPNLQ